MRFIVLFALAIAGLFGKPLVVVATKGIVKDKAYYTCRYEVQKLLRGLEEYDNVRARVVYARLRKKRGVYYTKCRFANLVGRRGVLRFPVRNVTFKYRQKAYDFVLDGAKADPWVLCIGIFHDVEDHTKECSDYRRPY